MEFDEVITTRRSIRNFKKEPVSDEAVNEILEAARLAASGSNIQPWRFVIVRSPEIKKKLEAVTIYRFALKAPVLIACCADLTSLDTRSERISELLEAGVFNDVEVEGEFTPPERNREQILTYLTMNVGIAVTHMMLKAVDLGLGTCWIGGFYPKRAKEILNLDDTLHVTALLPIGYPKFIPSPRPRFPMKNLIIKNV
ncbi:MAG: nitroreductase family protein [Desulfobacterales bacterium]